MNERGNELKVCSNGWVGVQPDPIVDTLRSTHSRKHPHSQGSQDFQARPPIASARSIRTNLPQVTIVGGLQKAGVRRGFAAPKHPGICSPQPTRQEPPLESHTALAKGSCSVPGPSQAAAGRSRQQLGTGARTESK